MIVDNNTNSKEIFLNDDLSSFVKSFWYYRNDKSDLHGFSILPDGCFVLLIDFVDSKMKSSYLTGIWNKKIEVAVRSKTEVYAIRFKALAAEYIIKQKIAELLNTGIEIPNRNYPFFEQINSEYQDFNSFVESNTSILKSIRASEETIDPRKLKLFACLNEKNGNVLLNQISYDLGWSGRQIRRYFNNMFGISFKDYASILRLNSTYKNLVKGEHYPDTNYFFDQSHYIKEIRKYTGVKPKTLVKNKTTDFYNYELGL